MTFNFVFQRGIAANPPHTQLEPPHSAHHKHAMTANDNNDCLYNAGKTTVISGSLGLVVSAMQNTVQKHTEGAKGVFTRTGGTIALFGN